MRGFHRIQGILSWRRKRDLNPRDPFEPYSLSRGAPSPLGYFSMVNMQSIDCRKKPYEMLAERVGFEPTVHCCITSFQDWLLKPLGHLSVRNQLYYYNTKYDSCQAPSEKNCRKQNKHSESVQKMPHPEKNAAPLLCSFAVRRRVSDRGSCRCCLFLWL